MCWPQPALACFGYVGVLCQLCEISGKCLQFSNQLEKELRYIELRQKLNIGHQGHVSHGEHDVKNGDQT
jgi:hypothetical protein